MERNTHEFDADKYVKAIEKALPELPVENGAIKFEAIWLETALPEDLILEIVKGHDLQFPPNVERIVTSSGQVLRERERDRNGSRPLPEHR